MKRWTRRRFLATWSVAGIGATLLAACGPQVTPATPTSAPVAPTTAPPAATTAPAANKPAAAATTAPAAAANAGATPKNGGSFRFSILTEDPPTLDPYLNVSFRTQEF